MERKHKETASEIKKKGFLKELEQVNKRIERPEVRKINPGSEDLKLMQIDVDYYTKNTGSRFGTPQEEAILRMFGITEEGNSICVQIHSFISYFYVEIPQNITLNPELIPDISKTLNDYAKNSVSNIKLVKKTSIKGYSTQKKDFLKIFVTLPKSVPQLRGNTI